MNERLGEQLRRYAAWGFNPMASSGDQRIDADDLIESTIR